jgi:hypothetical protein
MTVEIDKQSVLEIVREEVREGLKPALRLAALREKIFLSGKEVEELYGISESTLRCSRSRGSSAKIPGPKFHRTSAGKIFYEHCDVIDFIKSTHG